MLSLLFTLLSLASATIPEYIVHWPSGYDPTQCNGEEAVLSEHRTVVINSDNFDLNFNFYPFQYGEAGTYGNVNFLIGINDFRTIYLQDCYCSGDNFVLTNFGDFSFAGTINTNCDLTADCTAWSLDVETCYNSENYCSQEYSLSPGFYNLTPLIINSPYGFGQAFLVLSGGGGKK